MASESIPPAESIPQKTRNSQKIGRVAGSLRSQKTWWLGGFSPTSWFTCIHALLSEMVEPENLVVGRLFTNLLVFFERLKTWSKAVGGGWSPFTNHHRPHLLSYWSTSAVSVSFKTEGYQACFTCVNARMGHYCRFAFKKPRSSLTAYSNARIPSSSPT